jgi:hypothetical protein
MRSKRKASPVYSKQTSPGKRRETWKNRYTVISDDEEDDSQDNNRSEVEEVEWEINGILEETESQYLIDWVGDYSPTWVSFTTATEPKRN